MFGGDEIQADLERARLLLAASERVVGLTGAGISTDSGIPDFRGPDGVWTKNPEAEKLATISYYVSDPELRRRAWRRRLETLSVTYEPNPGHRAFAAMQARGVLDTLITQNVDGLHLASGIDPDRLVEIHGNTREFVCLSCEDRGPMEEVLDRVRAGEEDPPCRRCGGILKSATIFFGQGLVEHDLRRADAAARRADLVLAVGTTLGVYPVAGVVPLARAHGARLVIVNGGPTEMDDLADVRLEGSISELLPRLVEQ